MTSLGYRAGMTLREAADNLSRALNLYGADEIVEAAERGELEEYLARFETPECHHRRGTCDHGFPAWYVRAAGPAFRALRRVANRGQG